MLRHVETTTGGSMSFATAAIASTAAEPLRALHALAGAHLAVTSRIAGLEEAEGRQGWLEDDEYAEIGRGFRRQQVFASVAEGIWKRLSAEDLRALDDLVDAALERLVDGPVAHIHAGDLAPRAARLGAPERRLDLWALWAVFTLTGVQPGELRVPELHPELTTVEPADEDELLRLPEARAFRRSSVRGDFRIHLHPGGSLVTWRDTTVGRDAAGNEAWRIDGWGKVAAVGCDGAVVLAADWERRVAAFHTGTGVLLAGPFELQDHLFSLSPLPDNRGWIGNTPEALVTFSPAGEPLARLDAFLRHDAYRHVTAVAAAPQPAKAYVCVGGSHRLLLVDLATGEAEASFDYGGVGPDDSFLAPDGRSVVVPYGDRVRLHDPATLYPLADHRIPGWRGVASPADADSWQHFKPNPKLSPDGLWLACNDRSGLLRLLDPETGRTLGAWPREIVPYVEDVAWIDSETLLAVSNDGRVMRLRLDRVEPVFAVRDVAAIA
jgi:hypothetical protein